MLQTYQYQNKLDIIIPTRRTGQGIWSATQSLLSFNQYSSLVALEIADLLRPRPCQQFGPRKKSQLGERGTQQAVPMVPMRSKMSSAYNIANVGNKMLSHKHR